jgi:hypothetical protein
LAEVGSTLTTVALRAAGVVGRGVEVVLDGGHVVVVGAGLVEVAPVERGLVLERGDGDVGPALVALEGAAMEVEHGSAVAVAVAVAIAVSVAARVSVAVTVAVCGLVVDAGAGVPGPVAQPVMRAINAPQSASRARIVLASFRLGPSL